jgi:hypothetical protein
MWRRYATKDISDVLSDIDSLHGDGIVRDARLGIQEINKFNCGVSMTVRLLKWLSA